jgi:hypothetical protein
MDYSHKGYMNESGMDLPKLQTSALAESALRKDFLEAGAYITFSI